jgi:Glycine zipper 2TM domain
MRKPLSLLAALALAMPSAALIPSVASAHAGHGKHKYSEWRGSDGRTYCRKSNGTVGLVVGGAAGALIGRGLDGGQNRATGTILGAAGGALIGREIQRKRRCR